MWENWFIIICIAVAFFVQPLVVGDESKVWFWIYRVLGWLFLAFVLWVNDGQFLEPQFSRIMSYVCLLACLVDVLWSMLRRKSSY